MKIQTIAIVLFLLFLSCGFALSAGLETTKSKPQDKTEHPESTSNQQNVTPNFIAPVKTTSLNVAPLAAQPDNGTQKEEENSQAAGNKIAIYTFWLTVFTGLMVLVSLLMFLATRKLSAIAQNEFSATHRPRIIVHTMGNIGRTEDEIIPQFTYVNTGGSIAKVTEISTSVFFTEILRPGIDLKPNKYLPKKIIKPGERSTFKAPSGFSQKKSVLNEMKQNRGDHGENLFCVGVISYENAAGTKLETGFIRQFDGGSKLWLKINNSDYEYNY